ncbi:carbohydrate ABC transporter permease [Dactylosporangium sp. AC04546]|uniref:carbohydrate ABC transporter permease n=1 Tax=Dactylosporangium sp. AC04546 TaxID=2862460 RepID=UPI001EDE9A23|nr:carbohydrate ABC transporter permease [Dactylosporangium sp. AC04546]WVK87060.1 carbohydrate ABC transporter permease [Dactylosporangium sp. AC04546]
MTSLLRRGALFLLVGVIVVSSLFPFFWMLVTSFKPDSELFTRTPRFIVTSPTVERYTHLLDGNIPTQFRNSLIVAVATTVLTGLIALLAGYALARYRLRTRHILTVVILVTQLLPQTILVIPLFTLFRNAGLLNTFQGLTLSHLALTVGLCTFMLRSFVVEIPFELEEAALVDGASRLRAVWSIVFPLAWPGLAASSVYAFITSWNELMFSATYMQRPEIETLPVALQQYFSSYYTDWGGVMAASVIFTIPVVIFFLVVQKRLMQGMASGAMKG